MTWVTTARFNKNHYDTYAAVAAEASMVKNHLDNIALDVGLDPARNVRLVRNKDDVRVNISEEMDLYFRESPGEWR